MQKTQILTYKFNPPKDMQNTFDFSWNSKETEYLSIQIPKDISKIYDKNYGPLKKSIKSDIDRWSQLPLYMHNRIEIVKINLLPQLLYLFQSLPNAVTLNQFNEWDKWTSRFIFGVEEGQEFNLKHYNCLKRKGVDHYHV